MRLILLPIIIAGAIMSIGLAGPVHAQDFPSTPATPQIEPELIFDGAEHVSTRDLVDNFKSCSRDGWKNYDQQAFEYFGNKCVRQYLWSHGFLKATVREQAARIADNRYRVKFAITEGPRFRWGKITFRGLQPQYSDLFLSWFGRKEGDVADGAHLQDFVYDKLRAEYAERGFVQYAAEFDLDLTEPNQPASDGTANALISIDEGRQFRVNRIRFVGVSQAENKRLVDAFPLKKNDLFAQSKFEKGIEMINRSEKYLPADKDSDVDIRTDEESEGIDLIIRLQERPKAHNR